MSSYRIRKSAGFTLVEILIVVIILGILAAIVIPQFTNASQSARESSLASQLQTIRSQIQLFKVQHNDAMPTDLVAGGTGNTPWTKLTELTNADQTTTGSPALGPYLQAAPANSLSGSTAVGVVTSDPAFGAANPGAASDGWLINTTDNKIFATSAKGGFVYDEGNPSNPNNQN